MSRHLGFKVQHILKMYINRIGICWIRTTVLVVWVELQLKAELTEAFFSEYNLRCFRVKGNAGSAVSLYETFHGYFYVTFSCESDTGRNRDDLVEHDI